jgi:uncharacterized protein YcbK (DUF882 family)
VPIKSARTNALSLRPAIAGYGLAALLIFLGSDSLQNAVANGETRTISFHHIHTKEDLTVTYKRNGRYDEEALTKINQLMRDWRESEPIKMDPHLIDLLWEVHREVGAKEPIWVVCGYRSPNTNSMLRRRSSGVAKFSQHMLGKAIDFHIPGVALDDVQAAGLRSQRGGVGVYPSSGFVHMDTGSVRHWPRMPDAQLARVMAKGELGSRHASDNGTVRRTAVAQASVSSKPSFLARLFGGGGADEEEHPDTAVAKANAAATKPSTASKPTTVAAAPAKPADPAKSADKAAAKPADKAAAATPPARPAKPDAVASAPSKPAAKPDAVASAPSKPAAKPDGFQVASATAKTVATFVNPDDEPAPAASKPAAASFELASATSKPAARPAQATSLVARANTPANANMTANDVINERGYWQGPSEEPAPAPSKSAAPRRPAGTAVASADPKTTASIAPSWPLAEGKDDSRPANALAYAAQPTPLATTRPVPPMGSGNSKPAADTTLALKRSDDRPTVTTTTTAPPAQGQGASVVRVGDRFNDPWLRAMIVSPSAQGFMRTTLFGTPDYRHLGPYLQKPASSVVMTFSDDPYLGMKTDKFAGSAVVFITTVTFPARTASLR